MRVRPGEGRAASRLLAMMLLVWSGFAIGGNAIEGLLFARVGPDALPYLFVTLGVATAVVMLGMNALLARPRPQRLLLATLPAMAAAVLAMRAVLFLEVAWIYPPMWLAMMVLWTGVGVVTWGIAGAVHDTRQAKRLFPLYGSGLILGGAIGGVATAPLAAALGAENLLFLWAASLAAAFGLARSTLRVAGSTVSPRHVKSRSPPPVRARLAEGLRSVQRTPLLTWMAVSLALFAVLYFSLSLLFARAATARFPDADRLAGFLGLFMGVTSGAALMVSLFAANRLYARLGVATMVLVLPVVYLGGFAVLVGWLAFVPLLAFRFVQMVWINGVWAGAWQALYNLVPAERRDETRAFVDGVALQGGVVCAGVVLILADRVLEPTAVAMIGLGVAGIAALSAFRLRRAYPGAVVEALRIGNPDVFPAEEEPFGGFRRDAAALSVAADVTSDPDPLVRRVSVEILADVGDRDAAPVLLRALADEDAVVRAAALRGIARLDPAVLAEGQRVAAASALLRDVDAAVRLAAVQASASGDGRPAASSLLPLLADVDPRVRAGASAALLGSEADGEAGSTLAAMARSPEAEWRAAAVGVLGATENGAAAATSALDDPNPVVRRAAVGALGERPSEAVAEALVPALADADQGVRSEAVEALARMGAEAVRPLMEAASLPDLEGEAMRVLARLDGVDASVLRDYLRREASLAVRYGTFLEAIRAEAADPRLELLAYSLRHRSLLHAVNALQTASPLWDSVAVRLAIENLESRDAAQRANALEALEAVGERDVIRPLLEVWEAQARSEDPSSALVELMRDPDPWLRACAAHAAANRPQLRGSIERLARSDADTLVREAAASALRTERVVETLPSLSLMERIVFLRRVALFAELSPADLKHVAEIVTELAYPDGEVIAEQGEPGEEMYVVVSGEIRVLVRRGDVAPAEVARRTPGEPVGEMAIISRAPRMATLVADGQVRMLAIDRRRFERILRERPEASLAVMEVLCDRLRQSSGAVPVEARA